jgi:hypothetical protein
MTQDINKILNHVSEKISKHGWTSISVGFDKDAPAFTYSVGFTETFSSPEVVFLGIRPETAQSLISSMATQLLNKDIKIPQKDARMPHVIKDFDVKVRHIHQDMAGDIARIAARRSWPKPVSLVQIILPDQGGKFPGEAGCNPSYEKMQNIDLLIE